MMAGRMAETPAGGTCDRTRNERPRGQRRDWPNPVIGGSPRGGQNSGEDGAILPFLFWRVSLGRRRSPRPGAAEVSRGEPG